MAKEQQASKPWGLTPEQRERICSEGERIFREVITDEEKSQHHGGYVAIDIVDGRYAFGEDMGDADDALGELPKGHLGYLKRIGLPFRAPRSLRLRKDLRP